MKHINIKILFVCCIFALLLSPCEAFACPATAMTVTYDVNSSILSLTEGNSATVYKASYDAWGHRTVTNNTFNFHRKVMKVFHNLIHFQKYFYRKNTGYNIPRLENGITIAAGAIMDCRVQNGRQRHCRNCPCTN